MPLIRISPEETAWTQAQPVVGSPSHTRLVGALRTAGWEPLELALSDDGEFVTFRLRRNVGQSQTPNGREDSLRTLIRAFRQAGFHVGYTEVGIDTFDGEHLTGGSLVGPLEQVCEHGPVPVDP